MQELACGQTAPPSLRLARDHGEQHLRWPRRLPAAMLPIEQCPFGNADALGELALRKPRVARIAATSTRGTAIVWTIAPVFSPCAKASASFSPSLIRS